MSQHEDIRILADIPASPFQPNAPAKSSEVFSYTNLGCRKRSEIALAVDNHSVGIYDVRSGNTVSSYAVSPATTFTCPPSSIKLGRSGSPEARRSTYCSILDPQPKILHFQEDADKRSGLGLQLKTSAFDLSQTSRAIVHIEAFANDQPDAKLPVVLVLCVFEDGVIQCYDEAISSAIWTSRTIPTNDSGRQAQDLHVVHVSTVSIHQARQTILKNHEDILSSLHANHGRYLDDLLLILTRSSGDPLTLHILAMRKTASMEAQGSYSDRGMTEELASFSIPEPENLRGDEALFRLHTSSGYLYQGSTGNLSVYDLTPLTPRLVQAMNFPNAKGILSYLRISPYIVATAAPDSLFLVDTHFSSFQARYALPMSKQARARIPNDINAISPPLGTAGTQLLLYHSPSNSAIVLFGRSLIAVDLSVVTKSAAPRNVSRKRKRNGLLIDAIGRGSISVDETHGPQKPQAHLPQSLGAVISPYQQSPDWIHQRKRLDLSLEKHDWQAWDQAMVSTIQGMDLSKGKPSATPHLPDYKIDYVFGSMFSATALKSRRQRRDGNYLSRLRIEQLPRKTWNCLIQRGIVTIDRVEVSMKRQHKISYNHGFSGTDLVQALADHDTNLDALSSMLRSPCLLKDSEVCHALQIMLSRFSAHETFDDRKLLTQGEANVSPDASSTDQMEVTNAVSNKTQHHTSGDNDRFSAIFDAIIERCNACPASLLSKALRTQLSNADLRSVINLLRIRLAANGWLQPYTDDSAAIGQHKNFSNKEIVSVGNLLNCAIDSLGTGGWLLTNTVAGDTTGTRETISYMKNEIFAAVAGAEEATYLKGILGEMLLCGKSAPNAQANGRTHLVLFDGGDGQKAALPLGLKLDQPISLTKVGAGGELQKRSRRDIGKLKSRQVPKYSFERIAV